MFSTMAAQRLPERLELSELPAVIPNFKASKYVRGIQISFAGETLERLVEAIKDADGAQVSLGKKPAIITGDKHVRPIQPLDREKSFVYAWHTGESQARLAGVLSLKDAAARAKAASSQNLDLNDPAFQMLQQSLAELAQKKQASTTVLVKDSSQLPPAKSGRQGVKAATKANRLLKSHRQGLFDQNKAGWSQPSSPSLSGMTPAPRKPTAKDLQREALKVALIHLLAVRAVSEQYLVKTLRCQSADLKDLLEKYGRPARLDAKKFDLSDRGYKELDVWGFGYKDATDRQAAIDRAINAFDRQRISVRENVWQLLLPREERGKGKVLSKLNFRNGPVERVKTPQIHVQSTSDNRPNGKAAPEDGRPGHLAPSSAARSGSQEPPSKPKTAEKEKESVKKSPKPQTSVTSTTQPTKPSSPTAPKKMAPKKATAAAPNTKFKSAEFIIDSDDDTDMEGSTIALARPASKTLKSKDARPSPKPAKAPSSTQPLKPIPARKEQAPTSNARPNADLAPNPTKPTHKRKTSSPAKPSRLGSTPPTNASDLEIDGVKSSSSSSSPLIHQRRESLLAARKAPPAPARHISPPSTNERIPKRKAPDSQGGPRPAGRSERARDQPLQSAPKRRAMSPARASSSSDTATTAAGSPPLLRGPRIGHSPMPDASAARRLLSPEQIQSARRFKEMQARYSSLLREVRAVTNPPAERVERLHRMHSKLAEQKRSLLKLAPL